MKKILSVLAGAAMLALGGCSDDDAEGVLTDSAALVGKWQEVKCVEYYKEDGKWYTDVEYDVNDPNHESNYGDDNLYFDYFEADGTFRSEEYSKDGVLIGSSGSAVITWSYENGLLQIGGYDPVKVVVLTSSKLVTHDDWGDDCEDYDLTTYRRVK